MSYETYAHVQDMIEAEEKPAVTMKGINREIKVFSILGRKKSYHKKTELKLTKNSIDKLNNNRNEIIEIKKHMEILQNKIDILSKKIIDKV